ncbi:MAG: 23S rRNA (adenine(2503)-C(2))-methyltransferase RlmN [Chloroflexia bacterium]
MSQAIPISPAPELLRSRARNIYDLSPEAFAGVLGAWGEPAYRADQVLRWLYKDLVTDFAQMTNLPATLRERLAAEFRLGSTELVAQKISSDGWTRKVLLKMRDGNTIEAVLMLYHDRAAVCVSSQVGCAMGCTFCATGQMGFTRNLTAGEILEQVLWFNRWLREHPSARRSAISGQHPGNRQTPAPDPQPVTPDSWFVSAGPGEEPSAPKPLTAVTNIVFMGMGEPLVNYNNLWNAIRTLNSPQGLGMSARRLTVSTVGVAPQMRRFAREALQVNLAVSLHAPNDELRSSMMPMNDRYPVAELIDACRDYVEATHRRITFEYVLINGVNDGLDLARQLAARLKGLLCHVNLIPLNPVPGTGMRATPREQVFAFQKILEDAGVPTTVRIERGVDIAAACGQLKAEEQPGARHRSLSPELVQAHVAADLAAAET